MRYLKLREEFIKNNKFSNYSLIKEDSEPLANDIAWGDSLLGRLINSVIRKAEIGVNLVRIDSVINRLKESFDLLLSNAKIKGSEVGGEITLKIDKYLMSALLGVLKKEVDEGTDKKGIIDTTKKIIGEIKELQISKESVGDRDELISKLEEFLKSLEDTKTTQNDGGTRDNLLDIYPKLVENFTSVYKILYQYSIMKKEQGDLQKHLRDMDKKKGEKILPKDVGKKTEGEVEVDKAGKNIQNNGLIINMGYKLNESTSTDDRLISAIKPLYDYCVGSKNFTFLNTTGEFYTPLKDSKNKTPILKIYTTIRMKSINEGLTELLTRPEDLGAKILNLYNVTKTKESGDFTGIGDLMKGEIAKFNASMKEILSFKSKEEQTPTSESKLYRYIDFIKESDETVTPEDTESTTETTPEDKSKKEDGGFTVPFNKIFNADYMKKWIITEEEIRSIEIEITKVTKDSTKIVIDGIDPIIEIVKIFNRAYKIHTTSTIPSGRSGGKVSNRTFREYTNIGTGEGGTPAAPGSGPWRNNSLFDKWENAVLDIIKDSKYQVLFNEDTEIKVGSADPRVNVSKGSEGGISKKVQGGGKTLLTFINGMLDGNRLYKSGAQAKFIEEYFNVEVSPDMLGWKGKHGNDTESNAKNADKTKSDENKYSFKSVKDISPDFPKSFYAITAGGKKYYMYLTEKDNDYVYVKYSESFKPIKVTGVVDILKGDMDTIQMRDYDTNQIKIDTFYGRIRKSIFPIKPGMDLELKALNIDKFNLADKKDKDTIKPEELKLGKIDKVYGILSDENKLFILPEDKSKTIVDKSLVYKEKLK